MATTNTKELDSNYIMHTYGRNDVVIDHGKNATLFSDDNKKYIDFARPKRYYQIGTTKKGGSQ
jgi:acetylornithine/succinyldiaminopimelate/putrescine aminotransferase